MGFYDNENDEDKKTKTEARDMDDITDVTPHEMDDYTSASNRINPMKTSKFTKKQIILGVGGGLFGVAFLWAALSPNPVPESPIANTQPASIPTDAEVQQSQNMMGLQTQQPLPSTLMGSNDAGLVDTPFPPSQMAPQQQNAVEPVAAAPIAPAAPIAAAPTPAPTLAPVAAIEPAPRVVVEKVIEKDPALLKKIAVLEARIADLEKEEAKDDTKPAPTKPREVVAKNKPAVASYQAKASVPKKSTKPQRRASSEDDTDGMTLAPKAVAATKAPAVSDGDAVRVIGLTKRSTGTIALIEFGGIKHRVAQGDSVPGLGKVSLINQAGGAPSVQINGITYH